MKTPLIASLLSGLAWGIAGSLLTKDAFGVYSWYAAPSGAFIGITVYLLGSRSYRRSSWNLIPVAIISTFIAAALFGIALGIVDLARGIPGRIGWAVVVQAMNACMMSLVIFPIYWLLFPVAFANHALIRRLFKPRTD